jgi:hypothetical protein
MSRRGCADPSGTTELGAMIDGTEVVPLLPDRARLPRWIRGGRSAVHASAADHVAFYADEAHTRLLFSFTARRGLQHGGVYQVSDADGQPIGEFRKDYARSLLRST